MADSVTPETYTDVLGIGESVTIKKTVKIEAGAPTSAKVDVMFLCDLTGSMGSTKDAVQTYSNQILNELSSFGDVKFAVGSYMDEPYSPAGVPGDYPFRLESDLTDATSAQAAIDTWALGNGNDEDESQLYALAHSAKDVAWRDGSTRIVVWFGDYAGHDPPLLLLDRNLVFHLKNLSTLFRVRIFMFRLLMLELGNLISMDRQLLSPMLQMESILLHLMKMKSLLKLKMLLTKFLIPTKKCPSV
jgi:hypothetical protein